MIILQKINKVKDSRGCQDYQV